MNPVPSIVSPRQIIKKETKKAGNAIDNTKVRYSRFMKLNNHEKKY